MVEAEQLIMDTYTQEILSSSNSVESKQQIFNHWRCHIISQKGVLLIWLQFLKRPALLIAIANICYCIAFLTLSIRTINEKQLMFYSVHPGSTRDLCNHKAKYSITE